MAASVVNTVWLEILRAQRPITYGELAEALPELPHSRRGPTLNVAYRLGYVERSGSPRSYAYRVTPRCTVPPGITVLEVLEATS